MSNNDWTWTDHRKARALALLDEAGGDIERAVRLFYIDNEHFDGETVIALSSEAQFREDCGFPTADTLDRLAEARASEDALYARLGLS